MSDAPRPIRLLIVDDHAVVRQGIRHVLEAEEGFEIVAEAANADEAIARVASDRPDVILLDITMPGRSGLDAVRPLLEAAPAVRILMLSVHDAAEYVLRAVRAGAHGYVRKDTTPADLRAAIRAVHAGGGFFSPEVAGRLTSALREGAPVATERGAQAIGSLTAREREVLTRIAGGQPNKEVAAALGISVRTVEAHRDNLMRKLGIRSAAALTRLAIESGLLGASGGAQDP
ncbi:MAG: response regulator transcription factor [Gemmatimonadetes bacterium]|nr:response regulator transcription factor [Gemmatimonadota bacterium]